MRVGGHPRGLHLLVHLPPIRRLGPAPAVLQVPHVSSHSRVRSSARLMHPATVSPGVQRHGCVAPASPVQGGLLARGVNGGTSTLRKWRMAAASSVLYPVRRNRVVASLPVQRLHACPPVSNAVRHIVASRSCAFVAWEEPPGRPSRAALRHRLPSVPVPFRCRGCGGAGPQIHQSLVPRIDTR